MGVSLTVYYHYYTNSLTKLSLTTFICGDLFYLWIPSVIMLESFTTNHFLRIAVGSNPVRDFEYFHVRKLPASLQNVGGSGSRNNEWRGFLHQYSWKVAIYNFTMLVRRETQPKKNTTRTASQLPKFLLITQANMTNKITLDGLLVGISYIKSLYNYCN